MTREMPPRTVVFDLDGTLVDSLPLVLAAIRHAIEPFGGSASMDIFAHLGGPPQSFLPKLVSDPSHVPEAVRRMYLFHHGNAHLIRPYEGVRSLLKRLNELGVRVAIWTGRDRESTDSLLRTHDFGELMAAVVCGDDLSSHKPDPAGLREIMTRLGSAATETLFVGDADVDVLGGHACGVDTVLIRHGRVIEPGIREKSWKIVRTPADAYELVLGSVERPA